ncbi:MAG: glycosyltransferase family 2 protein [Lachnospiraceae bacterium]|nr:glycosyltransferase family 2 protein [Lachnospiraceae bacterium]
MERKPDKLKLSIVMPCRNEESTVGFCVETAKLFLRQNGIRGEILVVNNGSTDRSALVAERSGARVICVEKPGYGRALRAGLKASRGKVIIMGDCDATYDFREVGMIYELLADGAYDVVIGDRFSGGIEEGAMPQSHYWGVRWLSFLGRMRFHTDVKDFHCGLRGITRDALKRLQFRTAGMEFATEMIAVAKKAGLRIGQVPVSLRKCRFEHRSKVRIVRDGVRHLEYILGG